MGLLRLILSALFALAVVAPGSACMLAGLEKLVLRGVPAMTAAHGTPQGADSRDHDADGPQAEAVEDDAEGNDLEDSDGDFEGDSEDAVLVAQLHLQTPTETRVRHPRRVHAGGPISAVRPELPPPRA